MLKYFKIVYKKGAVMKDFVFYTPTKVYFGRDKHKEIGSILKEYGFKKIMIQYGKGSVVKSGLLNSVTQSLKESGIEFVSLGGVQPNPTLDLVHNAILVAKEEKVELILAVGGGSVLDSSKSTAAGFYYDGDVWDFHCGKAKPKKSLPVGSILTISAAGSEMSASSVITNTKLNMKRGFGSDMNRPLFAICNPELTYSVNKYQTACGIVDIMSHTMERYFTVCPDTPLTDAIAESILKSVIEAGRKVMKNAEDYDARATIMWASSLSHNSLTGAGRENALAVHQLEHALSGQKEEIAHGAGLAVLFPAWAKYVYKENIKRFASFGRNVWGSESKDDITAAKEGIEKMADFFKEIGMPDKLSAFGIREEDLDDLANLCTFGKKREIKTYISLDYERVKEIFELCL